MARYRIQAWGSQEYPDMDEFTDAYPGGLFAKYPFVHVAMLTPTSGTADLLTLEENGPQS